MNYTIISINQTLPPEDEPLEANYTPTEILGNLYRIEIATVHDECTIQLIFICGTNAGIYLEDTTVNKLMIEAYPTLDLQDIVETLSYEFPHIVNRNLYAEHAEKAVKNLISKGQNAVQNGTAVHIELDNNLLINLTRNDILYFADLEDAGE
jgi:ribosomal protein S4E